MEDKEYDKDDVQVMSVEEELKDFSPYSRYGCRPHGQSGDQSYFTSYI